MSAIEPQISVLLPVYNAAVSFSQALQSLRGQDFISFEVIIIDDQSTDDTAAIARAFVAIDPRFHYYLRTGPKGLAEALNFGLHLCKAPLVARMDADDLSLPHRLSIQFEFMQRHPEIAAVGAWFRMYGNLPKPVIIKHPTSPVICAWGYTWNSKLGHPTVMMRKSIVLEMGGYPDCQTSEDLALFSKMSRYYPVANIPLVLLEYWVHGENLSVSKANEMSLEVFRISQESLKTFGICEMQASDYFKFNMGEKIPLARVVPAIQLSIRIAFYYFLKYRNSFPKTSWGKFFGIMFLSMVRKLLIQLRILSPVQPMI